MIHLNQLQLQVRTVKGRDSAWGSILTEVEPTFGTAPDFGTDRPHVQRVDTGQVDSDGYKVWYEECWCYV